MTDAPDSEHGSAEPAPESTSAPSHADPSSSPAPSGGPPPFGAPPLRYGLGGAPPPGAAPSPEGVGAPSQEPPRPSEPRWPTVGQVPAAPPPSFPPAFFPPAGGQAPPRVAGGGAASLAPGPAQRRERRRRPPNPPGTAASVVTLVAAALLLAIGIFPTIFWAVDAPSDIVLMTTLALVLDAIVCTRALAATPLQGALRWLRPVPLTLAALFMLGGGVVLAILGWRAGVTATRVFYLALCVIWVLSCPALLLLAFGLAGQMHRAPAREPAPANAQTTP